MSNKSKYLVILGFTISCMILLIAIKGIFLGPFQTTPNEHTFSENLFFEGERVVQLGINDEFNISNHLKAFNDKGDEFSLVVEGDYDMSQLGVYFLKIKTDYKKEASISTNFTLIVFSEEDYVY